MKTQIENSILIVDDNPTALFALNEIVQICSQCNNEEQLKRAMDKIPYYISYSLKWGFGGHHMWVKQVGDKTNKRILFVEF